MATLVVSRDPGGAPFGEESALLSTVCELAAHAIAASRRADLRTEQLTLVQAVASAVGGATAIDEAFRMAATAVFEHTRYAGVTATMVDRRTGEQVVVVDLGSDVATTQKIRRRLDTGLVGACIQEQAQLVLAEATADPRYSWSSDGRWESLVLTPVLVEGRCEGVLELADTEPGRFDAADAALMQVVADQVATALVGVRMRERSQRLQHESQRRAQRLELASDLSREIAATGTVDELLRTVTVTLHRHTDYTAVWAAVADHRHGTQRMWTITRGRDSVTVSAHPLDSGIIGQVVRTGKQALLGRSHLADAGGAWAAAGYESLLATPVLVGRRCEAVIGLSDLRTDQFDNSDALLMRTLAEQVAAALHGAALREESDRRATRMNVIAEVARALRSPETAEQAVHDTAQAISRYTGYSGLTAWLVEPATDERRAVFARDRGTDVYTGLRVPAASGIPGAAITSGKVLRLGRAGDHPAFSWPGRDPNNSVLVTPVMVEGTCAAAFVISDEHPNWFDGDDEELVKAIADHLAAAIRAVELREESARQARRLALAADIAKLLAAEDTPESALRVAVEAVHRRASYDAVMAIMVLHESGEQLVVADIGADRDGFAGLRRPLGTGITARTVASGEQTLINRHEDDPAYAPWGAEESFDSLLSTPVMLDGRCVAVLEIASRPMNQFNDSDRALMTAVAEQLAAALRGVQLRNQSELRAQRLALTTSVANAVSAADTVEDVLRAAVDAIFEPTDYGAVTAILALPGSGEYVVVTDRVRVGESEAGAHRPIHAGAAGAALERGEQIVVGRLPDSGDADTAAAQLAYESALVTPVFDGQTAAVIALYDHRRDRFDPSDATLMQTVAEQITATLRAVRLRDESEQRTQRLALTTEVAGAIAPAETIDEVLTAVVETIYQGRGYSAALGIRVLRDAGLQVVVASLGEEGSTAPGLHRPIEAGTVGEVIASGVQLVLADARSHPAYDWPRTRAPAVRAPDARDRRRRVHRRPGRLRRAARPVRAGRCTGDADRRRPGRGHVPRRPPTRAVRTARGAAGGARAPPSRSDGTARARPGAGALARGRRPARRHHPGHVGVRDLARQRAPGDPGGQRRAGRPRPRAGGRPDLGRGRAHPPDDVRPAPRGAVAPRPRDRARAVPAHDGGRDGHLGDARGRRLRRADRLDHGDAHLPLDHRDPRQRARARGCRVGRRPALRAPATSSRCASPTTAAASTSTSRWPAPGARTTWASRR